MSIEAGSVYESFTFNQDNNPLWTIQGPLSGDTVAGLLVGITTLLNDKIINYNYPHTYTVIEIVTENGRGLLTIELNNIAGHIIALMDYKLDDATKDEIIARDNNYRPLDNSFGWWIYNPLNNKYTLFSFSSPDFIQGFISACNAFSIDFRDYILGAPFTHQVGIQDPTYYFMETYDIEPIPFPKKDAPVGAFYTGPYEADPYGEDYI